MKYIVAAVLFVSGAVLAAYVGIWVFFIGGIENVINGAKANPTNAGQVAWGLAEAFVLAELVAGPYGSGTGVVLLLILYSGL